MPIKSNTIMTLDSSGGIQNEWGADLFFMPHHLTIDSQNNVWVTDVALHQVFKFLPYGGPGKAKTPVIRLGTKVSMKYETTLKLGYNITPNTLNDMSAI